MLLTMNQAIDYHHHYNDPKAREYFTKETEYRHAQQLVEALGIGTNNKKRVQTFEKTWRFEKDGRYGFLETAVLSFETWVTWTSPFDCPIGDEVEHSDFERVVGYTAHRHHAYVVVPVFEEMPVMALSSDPLPYRPYREKMLWFDRMRAVRQGSELRCWRRVQ